ncbi:hypothetical protein [Aquibacillus rhizosphaerae]|uniref:Uncharacterized protein n=1 Tax=Aquibacillus rhizosphaerae TaxID=3051431 RepID=A0ABT7LDZ6_9BACI|nr:hypothetical protein [Aquibacillus sp. LR5S19]MDL4842815.1 hypothetical protein [Aquibacillus sp. LR5S19]
MKGVCLDASNTTTLEKDQEYFIFPNGESSFYVSNFDRKTAHFGCYRASRFEVLKDVATIHQEKCEDYSQMDLFDFIEAEPEQVVQNPLEIRVVIPDEVISPLECNHGVKTKAFKQVQEQWRDYVKSIQSYHECSWFKASEMLVEHRDEAKAIVMHS